MTQAPLDYQARSEAVAPGRRRYKRAAIAGAAGLLMAPVAVVVAFVAALAVEWTPAAQLLVPYATLLSGDGTLGGDDEVFVAVVAQFPAYGLIVGAAELTRERAGRRTLLPIGLIHVIAALGSFAASYAAGRA